MRTLDDLADSAYLKFIWKKCIRKGLRTIRLQDVQLARDCLDYCAMEWELDEIIADLAGKLAERSYRASAAETVRGAKGVGLTRLLAYLSPSDLIVYVALVRLVENPLLQQTFPWARFGRAQEGHDEQQPESGWFRNWLRRQNQIWTMTTDYEWLVETDIANFFPTLNISAITDHVSTYGACDEIVTNLLRHMLSTFAPMQSYRPSHAGGLPQENFDGSRVLAHTRLTPLDASFVP